MEKKVQDYKKEAVKALKEQLDGVNDIIFTDYRGLSVKHITDLRGKLRELNASFHVVKNNFMQIVLKELDFQIEDSVLSGPTAIAIIKDEASPVAKVLFEKIGNNEKESLLSVKGGIIGGEYFNTKAVDAYSKLPTKSELIAKLLGTMNAPIQHVAFAVNAVPQNLVYALNAIKEKKEQEG